MKTCFPAAAARSTWGPCSLCGVANTTASIAGSARIASRLSLSATPCSAQNASAWAGVRLWPAVKRIALLLPCTEPTRVRPHRPIPTIAARIMASSRAEHCLLCPAVLHTVRGRGHAVGTIPRAAGIRACLRQSIWAADPHGGHHEIAGDQLQPLVLAREAGGSEGMDRGAGGALVPEPVSELAARRLRGSRARFEVVGLHIVDRETQHQGRGKPV